MQAYTYNGCKHSPANSLINEKHKFIFQQMVFNKGLPMNTTDYRSTYIIEFPPHFNLFNMDYHHGIKARENLTALNEHSVWTSNNLGMYYEIKEREHEGDKIIMKIHTMDRYTSYKRELSKRNK